MAVAPEIGVELLLVAALLVCYGLLLGHKYLLSPILQAMANAFDNVVVPLPFHHVHPLRFAAKVVRAADASVMHWLGQAVLATQRGVVVVWHVLANQVEALGRLLGDLANSVEHVLTHVVTVQIPAAVARAETFTNHRIAALKATLTHDLSRLEHTVTHDVARLRAATEAELARLRRGIDRLERDFTHALSHGIDRVERDLAAVRDRVGSVAHDVARVGGRVGALERELTGVRGRLSSLEKLLGISAITGLVALALERLGLSWTRCNQVGRVGRNVCGMDPQLLESLLIDLVALAGTMSLVEFAREMQGVVKETERGVRHFWQAD